jgi:hypothetical protein
MRHISFRLYFTYVAANIYHHSGFHLLFYRQSFTIEIQDKILVFLVWDDRIVEHHNLDKRLRGIRRATKYHPTRRVHCRIRVLVAGALGQGGLHKNAQQTRIHQQFIVLGKVECEERMREVEKSTMQRCRMLEHKENHSVWSFCLEMPNEKTRCIFGGPKLSMENQNLHTQPGVPLVIASQRFWCIAFNWTNQCL